MMINSSRWCFSNLFYVVVILNLICLPASAQWKTSPNDTLVSYRILPDNQVRFSIYAPAADTVRLVGSDIPDMGRGAIMTKADNGIWQVTVGPMPSGAYRYNFNVDGIPVIDPQNPLTSQSNMNTWSLLYVSGSDFMDTKNVPHGAISEITYYSNSLQRFRRMHIYTPPGYQAGKGTYPVFYLLHGAFDCDDAWPSVGRAGFILDNLLAQKKAKPMVVVMPAGHTGPFRLGESLPRADEFLMDFVNDVIPYVETNYRIYRDRQHCAIAGLSMGGAQALNISIHDLEKYAYIGVFSSGILGITGDSIFGPEAIPVWEERNKPALDNENAKKGLQSIWFAIGKDDFLLDTSRKTVEMLKKHGFTVVYKETPGGHTWINWRDYLVEFAQLLFR
jgi:enterochelin esterase-like enzyme